MNPDRPLSRREFAQMLAGGVALGHILDGEPAVLAPSPGDRTSEVVLRGNVMVRMRDGARLATDIYMSGAPGARGQKFSVILERTPYNKAAPSTSERTRENPVPLSRAQVAEFFVRRGYIVAYQDCRGRYKSEGEFSKYSSDGNDGYDTCAWILAQPWCNGRIGTMGFSDAAHTQGALGSAAAPGVAAMFLDSGGFSNAHQGATGQGRLLPQDHYDRFVDAAMVHMSSWYDPYLRSATDDYAGLSKRKRGPVRLIIGPWTHGDRQLAHAGDVDFGNDAKLDGNLAPDFLALRLRWFDRWLKGLENGVDTEPKVRIFVMGGGSGRRNAAGRLDHGGRWRAERDWPIPGTRSTRFYFHRSGLLSTSRAPEDFTWDEYDFDPRNPVPTIGGAITSSQAVMLAGAFDQREDPRFAGSSEPYGPLSQRHDVFTFQTPPLQEDVEVTGPITAHLWIRSNCPDTDFTVKLVDVHPQNPDYPHGFAMNLTDGILRVRYRDSPERPTLMVPGTVYAIRVEAFPTSNRFMRGHRIRIDISSSNFPRFDLNTNTGEPEGRSGGMRVATNRLYMDRARPSHVVLPVVPERR